MTDQFHTPSLGDEDFKMNSAPVRSAPSITKKDPNAPVNPLSPYAFFFKETQQSIKTQQPDATFENVSKIVEAMWAALEEEQKEKYKKMNEVDRERYTRELEAYNANKSSAPRTQSSKIVVVAATADSQEKEKMEKGICIRRGCGNGGVRNIEWEDEYCSNECVVKHCETVFKEWVQEQKAEV